MERNQTPDRGTYLTLWLWLSWVAAVVLLNAITAVPTGLAYVAATLLLACFVALSGRSLRRLLRDAEGRRLATYLALGTGGTTLLALTALATGGDGLFVMYLAWALAIVVAIGLLAWQLIRRWV